MHGKLSRLVPLSKYCHCKIWIGSNLNNLSRTSYCPSHWPSKEDLWQNTRSCTTCSPPVIKIPKIISQIKPLRETKPKAEAWQDPSHSEMFQKQLFKGQKGHVLIFGNIKAHVKCVRKPPPNLSHRLNVTKKKFGLWRSNEPKKAKPFILEHDDKPGHPLMASLVDMEGQFILDVICRCKIRCKFQVWFN